MVARGKRVPRQVIPPKKKESSSVILESDIPKPRVADVKLVRRRKKNVDWDSVKRKVMNKFLK